MLHRFWLGCFTCALATAVTARAQDDAEPAEYQQLVRQALHEYDLGDFSEARAFFRKAHALSPSARTLRGLGMASYELREYVEAIADFQQALDSNVRPLTPAMRGEVTRLLEQARSFVTKLHVHVEPDWAKLSIDLRPVKPDAQGIVLVDPGAHELLAEAPDYESATHRIRTDGGEALSLSIALRPVTQPIERVETHEAPAPPLASATPTREPALPSPARSSSLGSWLLIGSGAALTIAGGVFIALMLNDKSTVENAHAGAIWHGAIESANARVLPYSVVGFSALGVGVAALGGGLAWKLAATSGEREQAPSARLELLPGGARLRGEF